jgi:hypothetical protein
VKHVQLNGKINCMQYRSGKYNNSSNGNICVTCSDQIQIKVIVQMEDIIISIFIMFAKCILQDFSLMGNEMY